MGCEPCNPRPKLAESKETGSQAQIQTPKNDEGRCSRGGPSLLHFVSSLRGADTNLTAARIGCQGDWFALRTGRCAGWFIAWRCNAMKDNQRHSLAQSRRDELVRQVRSRGKKTANIWYVFVPGSRTDAVLVGDPRFELFLATEGDPDVRDAEYNPNPQTVRLGDVDHNVQFDAFVRRLDGRVEYRDVHETSIIGSGPGADPVQLEIKKAAAGSMGAEYREFTFPELDALQQRTQNWARAIPALARCRNVQLAPIEHELALQLADGSKCSLRNLLQVLCQEPAPCIVAAVVSLLRKRAIRSDMDIRRWGLSTLVWMGARQS